VDAERKRRAARDQNLKDLYGAPASREPALPVESSKKQ